MKWTIVVSAIVVLGLSATLAAGRFGDPPCFDPTGAWIAKNIAATAGPGWDMSLFPTGRPGEWTGRIGTIYANPTLGLFPEVDAWSSSVGTVVKTGRNRFESTFFLYGLDLDSPDEPQYILIGNSVLTFLDCDTIEAIGIFSGYLPEQDADGDGFPDEGEEPFACVENLYVLKRVLLMTPCEG